MNRLAENTTATITVVLWICGPKNFEPNEFTSQHEIEPNKIWRCKPKIAEAHPHLDRLCWVFELKRIVTCEYSKALNEILVHFHPKRKQLIESFKRWNLTASIHLVPKGGLRDFDTTISTEIVRKIADLDASLVISNDNIRSTE